MRKGEFGKASEKKLKALEYHKQLFGDNHQDQVKLYSDLGLSIFYDNNFEDAEKLFEKSIQIAELNEKEDSHELAIVYENLSQVYYKQNRYDESIEKLNACRKILTKLYGEHSSEVMQAKIKIQKINNERDLKESREVEIRTKQFL